MNKIRGLIAAPFTPMDEKGAILYDRIPEYYDFLKRNLIAGAFINGSTGEGVSLTGKERMTVTENWMSRARDDKSLKIINLVGGTSYAECIDHAAHSADRRGYDLPFGQIWGNGCWQSIHAICRF